MLQSNSQLCDGIQRLGGTSNVSDDLFTVCKTFVCQLYGSKTNSSNDCRYKLFSVKGAQGDNLPPTQDALQIHVQRANYQAAVWVRALQAKPVVPSPCEYGWEIANDQLTIKWMTRKPAPDDLLVLVNCRCHTECSPRRCSCVREGMPCTMLVVVKTVTTKPLHVDVKQTAKGVMMKQSSRAADLPLASC